MPIETYFSHSWHPEDVKLNLFVWEVIAGDCDLYVDRDGADTGIYYINRLEELIRKSDVFVSVLSYRKKGADDTHLRRDYQLQCAPAALFELRLAERARKPRWIVYDDRTGFTPMQSTSDLVVYTPIDAVEELKRGGRNVHTSGKSWLDNVKKKLKFTDESRSRQAALLIDESQPDAKQTKDELTRALHDTGYAHITVIEPGHTDAEVIIILQAVGLLVAEIGTTSLGDIYAMAHAMFIPTIRFMRNGQSGSALPRLLDGHPGGYQHDLLICQDVCVLAEEVGKRAQAMRDQRSPIENYEAGCAYLRRHLYRDHNVFFSHNLPDEDADLLNTVFELLQEKGIRAWEYRHNNRAGVVWKDEMETALTDATDVVFIMADGFELSESCTRELDALLSRKGDIRSMLPFFWGNRSLPNPKLSDRHFESLPSDKSHASRIVVERLITELTR